MEDLDHLMERSCQEIEARERELGLLEGGETNFYFRYRASVLLACLRLWRQDHDRADESVFNILYTHDVSALQGAVRELRDRGTPEARRASQFIAGRPVTFDPATPAEPPIGRDVHRRVDPITAAALACPLVAGLHGGRHGHVAHYPAAMDEVARQVRNAVAPFMAGLAVNVTIEDLSTSDVCVGDTPRPSAPPARPGWIARVIPRRPQHESRTT